jgi:hypothetical protein
VTSYALDEGCVLYQDATAPAGLIAPAVVSWAGRLPAGPGHVGGPAVVEASVGGGAVTIAVGVQTGASDQFATNIVSDLIGPGAVGAPDPQAFLTPTATGVAAVDGPVALRLPILVGYDYKIGQDILVVAPPGAAKVSVRTTEGTDLTAPVVNGIGIVSVPIGHAVGVRTLTATGAQISASAFADPAAGPVLFGIPAISNW